MNWLSNIFAQGIISGRWAGHYEQNRQTFQIEAIEASLKHRGNKITGAMLDQDNEHQQPLRSVLKESGLPDDEIEDFIAEVRSQFPDSPDGDIEYRSFLPERSIINGDFSDMRISFVKRYEGYYQIEYVLNDLALPQSTLCELVEYTGTLQANSNTILGDWTIAPTHESEVHASGPFELKRQSAS